MTSTTTMPPRRAPADVRVRWHRPVRLFYVDRQVPGGWLTVPGVRAYRSLHKAMTAARIVAVAGAAATQPLPEQPC